MGDQLELTPLLRMIEGDAPGRIFELTREEVSLGRLRDCDIVLPKGTVSKKHATIRRQDEGYVIADNFSHNKTWVNGIQVDPDIPRPLRHGDSIKICEFSFTFHHPNFNIVTDDDHDSTIIGSLEIKSSTTMWPVVSGESKLRTILELSRDIGSSLELPEVLDRTLESLFAIYPQADRAFILLRNPETGVLSTEALRFRGERKGQITLSRTILIQVMDEGKAILSANVPSDLKLKASQSLNLDSIATIMCVPLLNTDRTPIGMIQIDTKDSRSRFEQSDLDLLAAVGGPVGLSIVNARLHQSLLRLSAVEEGLRNAQEVQLALLPDSRPDPPGYLFWDRYLPAERVGGDYFDYLPLPDCEGQSGAWAVAIGDVSGKGMPAALLMAKLSADVRRYLLTESDPVTAVERLNNQLCDDRFPERFITFLMARLNTSNHVLTVVNAGHMEPIVRRASGTLETIGEGSGGPPLSIFANTSYCAVSTTLEPGDVAVLFTDGVNEAMDPKDKILGFDRLRKAILAAPFTPQGIGESILKAIKIHACGCKQSDDIGLICFGRDPAPTG